MTDTYVVGTSGKPTITKDPDATLDYTFNWSGYLLPIVDAISAVKWTLSSGTLVSSSFTPTSATAWVSGGTLGTTITLTCQITTSSTPPRVDERNVYIKIKEL